MWEKINNFLKGQIVTSLIYIVLGVCLVFMPVNTINVICKFVFGILLILVGLYHIVIYGTRNFPVYESADRGQTSPDFARNIYPG